MNAKPMTMPPLKAKKIGSADRITNAPLEEFLKG